MHLDYKGCMAPVFTPFFRESNEVNFEVIPEYADYLFKSGIKGVLVNGSAGEGPTMSVEEKKLVLEAWMKEAKKYKFTVMVQIGGIALQHVLQLAKHAEKVGVSALLCLPDLFYRPKSGTELVNYLKIISDAAPNTPLFYYHIPTYTAVYLDMVDFLTQAADNVPTIAGVKFTHNNLQEGAQLLQIRSDLSVFVGNEQTLAGQRALGIDSCIVVAANCFPKTVIDIFSNIENGNTKKALELQNNLNAALLVIKGNVGGLTQGMKSLMKFATGGLDLGFARLPQPQVAPSKAEFIWREIQKFNLTPHTKAG